MNDTPQPIKGKKMRARYRTPEEIAAKVDKAKEKIRLYTEQAVAAEAEFHELMKHGARADASMRKDEADRLWKQVQYQAEKRLPKLKDRMAAIQTELLPFAGNTDRSVAA